MRRVRLGEIEQGRAPEARCSSSLLLSAGRPSGRADPPAGALSYCAPCSTSSTRVIRSLSSTRSAMSCARHEDLAEHGVGMVQARRVDDRFYEDLGAFHASRRGSRGTDRAAHPWASPWVAAQTEAVATHPSLRWVCPAIRNSAPCVETSDLLQKRGFSLQAGDAYHSVAGASSANRPCSSPCRSPSRSEAPSARSLPRRCIGCRCVVCAVRAGGPRRVDRVIAFCRQFPRCVVFSRRGRVDARGIGSRAVTAGSRRHLLRTRGSREASVPAPPSSARAQTNRAVGGLGPVGLGGECRARRGHLQAVVGPAREPVAASRGALLVLLSRRQLAQGRFADVVGARQSRGAPAGLSAHPRRCSQQQSPAPARSSGRQSVGASGHRPVRTRARHTMACAAVWEAALYLDPVEVFLLQERRHRHASRAAGAEQGRLSCRTTCAPALGDLKFDE